MKVYLAILLLFIAALLFTQPHSFLQPSSNTQANFENNFNSTTTGFEQVSNRFLASNSPLRFLGQSKSNTTTSYDMPSITNSSSPYNEGTLRNLGAQTNFQASSQITGSQTASSQLTESQLQFQEQVPTQRNGWIRNLGNALSWNTNPQQLPLRNLGSNSTYSSNNSSNNSASQQIQRDSGAYITNNQVPQRFLGSSGNNGNNSATAPHIEPNFNNNNDNNVAGFPTNNSNSLRNLGTGNSFIPSAQNIQASPNLRQAIQLRQLPSTVIRDTNATASMQVQNDSSSIESLSSKGDSEPNNSTDNSLDNSSDRVNPLTALRDSISRARNNQTAEPRLEPPLEIQVLPVDNNNERPISAVSNDNAINDNAINDSTETIQEQSPNEETKRPRFLDAFPKLQLPLPGRNNNKATDEQSTSNNASNSSNRTVLSLNTTDEDTPNDTSQDTNSEAEQDSESLETEETTTENATTEDATTEDATTENTEAKPVLADPIENKTNAETQTQETPESEEDATQEENATQEEDATQNEADNNNETETVNTETINSEDTEQESSNQDNNLSDNETLPDSENLGGIPVLPTDGITPTDDNDNPEPQEQEETPAEEPEEAETTETDSETDAANEDTERIALEDIAVDSELDYWNAYFAKNAKSYDDLLADSEAQNTPLLIVDAMQGNAGGGCSIESPCSLTSALSKLAFGGTILIREGDYELRQQINIDRSGTEASPIVIRNYPEETVLISGKRLSGNSADTGLLNISNQKYIRIQGLEFADYSSSKNFGAIAAIMLRRSASNIEIIRNHIHHIKTLSPENNTSALGIAIYGTSPDKPMKDLLIQGNRIHDLTLGFSESLSLSGNVDGFRIEGNHVHDVDNIGIVVAGSYGTACWESADRDKCDDSFDYARNGIIKGNTVYNVDTRTNSAYPDKTVNAAAGIYVDGARSVVVEQNRVYSNGSGLSVSSENAGGLAKDIIIRNNLIYNNHRTGINLGAENAEKGRVDNTTITNNTFYNNDLSPQWGGEIFMEYDVDNSLIMNNIFYADNYIYDAANDVNIDINLIINDGLPPDISGSEDNQLRRNIYHGKGINRTWQWQGKWYNHESFEAFLEASGDKVDEAEGSIDVDPGFAFLPENPDEQVDEVRLEPSLLNPPTRNSAFALETNLVGEFDKALNPRVKDDALDIGAYEY